MQKLRTLRLIVLAFAIATAPAASFAAAADSPYTISARALLGPAGTDVYVSVTPAVAALDKVQLKAWPVKPGAVQTRNFFDVETAAGVATLHLDDVARDARIEVSAHVKDGPQNNLETDALVRLRPDLVVRSVNVPADVTRRHAFDARVDIAEVAGDTAATAVVTLFDGISKLGQQVISVEAGGTTAATFSAALDPYGLHQLCAEISGAAPAESNEANNGGAVQLDVHRYLQDGVVSTEDWQATSVGIDMLRAGGNAFDAAAAILFALNVTDPHLAGIGGAANIVVQLADGSRHTIDGREAAPAAITPDLYAGVATQPNFLRQGFVVGVPGALRAVETMLNRWGTKSLAETLDPAIKLAEEGITVGAFLAADAATETGGATPALQAVFRPNGVPIQKGTPSSNRISQRRSG
jgi:hypothetical protein